MENPSQKRKRQIRDKEILKLYPDLTMREIARRYKISVERVRQILEKLKVVKQ